MREWLVAQLGDRFVGPSDGDTYTVKEAQSDFLCRRCHEMIHVYWPYARGTWWYAKFHITCAKDWS